MNRLNKHEDHAASKKERHTEIYKHGTSDMAVDDEMMLDVGFDVGLMWKPLQAAADGIPFAHLRSCDSLDLVGGRIWSTSCGTLLGTSDIQWLIVTQGMPRVRLAPFLPLEQKRDTLRHRGGRLSSAEIWAVQMSEARRNLIFCVHIFFPRASEQRVLLKVEVCYTSSHVDIFFSSSHLHIFSLSFFALSLSLPLSDSRPLSWSLSFFFFPLLRPQAVSTRRHNMATFSHEMRFECQKLSFFFASLDGPAATLSHEMRFECRSRCVWKGLCVKVFVCKIIVCKSVCV